MRGWPGTVPLAVRANLPPRTTEAHGVRRRVMVVAGVALLVGGCGGGGSSPSAPTPTPTPSSAVVVLDSSNFDALVLAAPKPSAVEFHSPT